MKKIKYQNLFEGPSYEEKLAATTKGLVAKWQKTGLLRGLKTQREVSAMSLVLENQAKQLVKESSLVNGPGTEEWSGIALPLVRRLIADIAAQEFVSVQPMAQPSGLVFFLDFKYGSGAQLGFTQNASIYGGDKNADGTTGLFGRTNSATGGLYGAGHFAYSINNFQSASLTATVTTGSWIDVNLSTALSASAAVSNIKKLAVTAGPEIDVYAARAFNLSSANATNAALVFYHDYTTVSQSGANYVVTFVADATAATALAAGTNALTHASASAASAWTLDYVKQTTADNRGDFEDISVSGSFVALDIPEVDIMIKSETVVAKTRKMKAVWTQETVQDLQAYQAVDAEMELTNILNEHLAQEIDLEILEMLIQAAPTIDYWSARIGYEYNAGTKTLQNNGTNAMAYTQQTWFQTLGTKITKMSSRIHQKTLRGGANFLVCSPDVATILESIPGYATDAAGDEKEFAMGISRSSSFKSRIKIYKNPYFTNNVMLLGYKGTSFFESGAAYLPYVPLMSTPVIYDPVTFTPRKGIMTRYAKKVLRPEFFGLIGVEGIDVVF
jgi:hypothetical protein